MRNHIVCRMFLHARRHAPQGIHPPDPENDQICSVFLGDSQNSRCRVAVFHEGEWTTPQVRFLWNEDFESMHGLGYRQLSRLDRLPRFRQRQDMKEN